MPVQMGYGAASLDFIGCLNGVFFAIETKKPGSVNLTTPRQKATIEEIRRANGNVIVVDGGYEGLENWLNTINDIGNVMKAFK